MGDSDRPTLPTWAADMIRSLEAQLDRLYSGRACRECRGSGVQVRGGKAGVFECVCWTCNGTGASE